MRYLIIILFLFSCNPVFIIDSRIKIYVDNFYHEANVRGVILPKSNLIIKLKKGLFNETGALGRSIIESGIFSDKQETVYIDEEFFNSYKYNCVESVVFHELGHTLLNRKDHEYRIPSIMGNGYICYCKDGYKNQCDASENQRSVFLDELFYNR